MEYKICSNGDCENPRKLANYDNFYKQKRTDKEGNIYYTLQSECKECRKKKQLEYNMKNRDKKIEYQKQYYIDNAEYHKDYARKRKEERKEYYKENSKQWRKNNPDKVKEYNKQHSDHKISKKEWKECKLYFDNKCAYCEMSEQQHRDIYKKDLHRDHFYPSGENDLSNCVPACLPCNVKKRDYPPEKFLLESNIEEHKVKKIYKWLEDDYKIHIKAK